MTNRASLEELKNYYKGEYVAKYETYPIERIERLAPFFDLKKTDVVADFACGNGMLLDLIHDKVGTYYGVDFSEEFIDAAKKRAGSLNVNNAFFECSDIIEFCQKNKERFDKAFTLDFGYLISDDVFISIHNSIHRSLKEDGILYFYVPNGDFLLEILKKRKIINNRVPGMMFRNNEEYIKLLKESGFRNIQTKYLSHYNSLKYLHFLSYMPVLGKYFKAKLFIRCIK